ncbi:hypothetical protein MPSEU_000135000 [Mayamaea pseudoterrestris]|nr:hypothetical protein MPSEU_000135000 [Mayamaea pseudoterrestris]
MTSYSSISSIPDAKDHRWQEADRDEETDERKQVLQRLKCAIILCSIFLIVETLGGFLSGSLAVLSDAAHLLSDLASFAVALAANYLASLPSTSNHTYGLQRTESLAALFSMVSLVLVCVGLASEAMRRLYVIAVSNDDDDEIRDLYQVNGKLMSQIAAIGVFVNIVLAYVLGEHHVHLPGGGGHDHSHSHGHDDYHAQISSASSHHHASHEHDHSHNCHCSTENDKLFIPTVIEHQDEVLPEHKHAEQQRNVNLHAAYLHVLGDLAQSVAVLLAGVVIWFRPTWVIVDPIITLCFCLLVFYSTIGVFRSSISVLLEAVPPRLSWKQIYDELSALESVTDVHDLHIWCISDGVTSMSVHASAVDDDCAKALQHINNVCRRHKILHVTVQVQPLSAGACITCTTTNNVCHGQ